MVAVLISLKKPLKKQLIYWLKNNKELKTIETLKDEVSVALTERGYVREKIKEWLEYGINFIINKINNK